MPAPPPPNVILRMTWVHQGMDWLLVGGAAILSAIAVAPEVFRRGCGRAFSPGLIRTHAWLTLIGVALIALPLLGAGVIQGLLLAGGERPFLDALRASLGLVRISTLGYAAFFFGQVALFLAALGAAREAAAECVAMARDWAGPAGAGEARARS
jgi:cbb3-type cytochrome oxidase subunit 1